MGLVKFLKAFPAKILKLIRYQQFLFVMTEKFLLNFSAENHYYWSCPEVYFQASRVKKIKIKRSFKSFFHRDQHFSIYKEKFFDLMLL